MTTVPPPSRRLVLGSAIPAVLAIGATGALASPRPAFLGDVTGDADLAAQLAPHLDGHRRVAVALLDGSGARHAGFGTDEHGEFEIGSISKTFAGALVMEAVGRGELTLGSSVGDLLGEQADGSAIADRTIAQLASHSAGLPRLPRTITTRALWTNVLRKNPYDGYTGEDVITDALAVEPEKPGPAEYSNLGAALEGQLTAHVGGSPWTTLLAARLLEPLGLTETRSPLTADDLGADAPLGHTANGHRSAAWTMDGMAPTGGIRSTAADMATYLASMMDGSNPGAAGLEPLAQVREGLDVGVNWHLLADPDVVWHNGMTGGFASFCGWNRATGRGIVLLTDTATSVDDLALAVLSGEVAA